jgi:hypothetical protein
VQILSVLTALGQSISANAASTTGETNWLRFSSVLTHFEKKCWFYEDVLLPMGVLNSPEFYHYIRCGYVLKDYGAGVKHGEFTHRLQWHVIMAVATESFTRPIARGWDHSPFDLYTSLGKQQNWGIWTRLLDKPGDGTFTHPDSFHQWLLQNAPATIKAFLVKRETKRREQFIYDICKYIEAQAALGDVFQFPDRFLPGQFCDPKLSHEDFKEFEKWFVGELYKRNNNEKEKVKPIYNSLANASTAAYLKNKAANPKTLQVAPKHRTKAYVPLKVGAVYALSGVPVKNENDADKRVMSSKMGLRQTYAHVP